MSVMGPKIILRELTGRGFKNATANHNIIMTVMETSRR
jgi:hypothetical protein